MSKYRCDKRCLKCLFHGKIGNIDCCDFFEMTGVMRPKVEPCIVFEPTSEEQWKKLQKNKRTKDSKTKNIDRYVNLGLIPKDIAEKSRKYENLNNKGYEKERSREKLWNLLTK